MVALGLLGIWMLLRLPHYVYHQRLKKRKVATLAFAAQIGVFIATVLRMVFLTLRSSERTMDYLSTSGTMDILGRVIISNIVTALLMAASSLIIGFWFDLAIAKMKLRTATITRTVCIVSAVGVLIISTIGFVMIVVFKETNATTTMIVVLPLVLAVAAYLGIAITLLVLTRGKAHSSKSTLVDKQRFAKWAILALTILWVLSIVLGSVGGILSTTAKMDAVSTYVVWVFQVVEIGVIFLVQLMLARQFPPWVIVKDFQMKSQNSSTQASTTTGVSSQRQDSTM